MNVYAREFRKSKAAGFVILSPVAHRPGIISRSFPIITFRFLPECCFYYLAHRRFTILAKTKS